MKTKIIILTVFSITAFIFSCKKEEVDTRPKDIDGNVYDTVKIGTQIWMIQNLKTTRYKDGTPIITNLNNTDWGNNRTGAYAVYDNNATNDSIYGKLYNWQAVHTGKLAPNGWHVPNQAEWTTLITYLGGQSVAGDKMKATTLWTPFFGITNTNSSGFSGLPAGFRNVIGPYDNIGFFGYFWSSTETGTSSASYCNLNYNRSDAELVATNKGNGLSVRCVRD